MAAEKQTIVVKSTKQQGDWVNVTTSKGKVIAFTKSKNPLLAKQFETDQTDKSVTLMVNVSGDKLYGGDVKADGPKFAPKPVNLPLETLKASCQLHGLRKDSTTEQVIADAEIFLNWLKTKA